MSVQEIPAYGWEEWYEIGQEVSYAADPSTNPPVNLQLIRPATNGITIEDPPIEMGGMSGASVRFHYGDKAAPCNRLYKEIPNVGGPLEYEFEFLVAPYLIGNALWNHSRAGTGTDIIHTFEIPAGSLKAADRPTSLYGRRLAGPGAPPGGTSGTEFVHLGGYVDVLEMNAVANQLVRLLPEIRYARYENADPAAALTTTEDCPVTSMLSDIKVYWSDTVADPDPITNGIEVLVHELVMRHENQFRFIPGSGTGYRMHRQPDHQGYHPTMITLTRDYEDQDWFLKWAGEIVRGANNGFGTLWIVLDTGIEVPGTGTAHTYKITIQLDAAKVVGPDPTHPGNEGPVPENLEFEGGSVIDGGVQKVGRIVLQNDQDIDYT